MSVLFRRHIVGSSDTGAGQILFPIEDLGDAEISKFYFFVENEDIGSLEIPVQNPFVVHIEDG